MKKLVWFIGLLASAALFQSCNGGGGDNNAQPALACPAGSWYSNGYCYNPNNPGGIPSQYSYSVSFYAGRSANNWNYGNTLQVVNGQKMKEFLKFAMGTCDRGNGIASQPIGQSTCDAYLNGDFSVTIQMPSAPGQDALVNFTAAPQVNPYFNYGGQVPTGQGWAQLALGALTGVWLPNYQYTSGAYRNPLQLSLKVSAWNNSQGFKLHGYGDAWTSANVKLISIEVPRGKKEDNSFQFYLQFQGVNFAQGVMQKLPY